MFEFGGGGIRESEIVAGREVREQVFPGERVNAGHKGVKGVEVGGEDVDASGEEREADFEVAEKVEEVADVRRGEQGGVGVENRSDFLEGAVEVRLGRVDGVGQPGRGNGSVEAGRGERGHEVIPVTEIELGDEERVRGSKQAGDAGASASAIVALDELIVQTVSIAGPDIVEPLRIFHRLEHVELVDLDRDV